MPPVSPQQGSRAGLISGLVAAIIFALVFAVFYFQERGLRQKAENEVKATEARFVGIIAEGADLPENVKAMREASNPLASDDARKTTLVTGATNAFDLTYGERAALIKVLTGSSSASAWEANAYSAALLKEAAERLKNAAVKPEGVNFTAPPPVVAKQIAEAYVKLAADKVAADKSAGDAQSQVAAANKDKEAALAAANAQTTAAHAETVKLTTSIDAQNQQNTVGLEQVKTSNIGSLDAANQQKADAEAQLAKLSPQIPLLQKEIDSLRRALKNYRLDPTDNMVRRPDGVITAISEDRKTCFIDLGEGDRIVEGMTFEIYDAARGIPSLKADIPGYDDEEAKRTKNATAKLNEKTGLAVSPTGGGSQRYDSQLPEGGKGSIEVIKVGPGRTSQCRIVKATTQTGIRAGDLIANLVYDRNVKLNFVVFGQFDLDYNGITTLSDTATIKRLIEQWGAKVVPAATADDVTPSTDYIVMGIAPTIPTATPEDAANPAIAAQIANATAQKVAYDAVMQKARDFSIPILNQTRFLYYTGYFDQRIR